MAKYALVNPSNAIIREEDQSRVDITAGTKAGYRWLLIEEVIVGSGPVTVSRVDSDFGTKVVRTTTLRQFTANELDQQKDDQVASEADRAIGRAVKLAFNAIFFLANDVRSRHGQAPLTLAQFRTAVTGMNDIDDAAFRAWVKTL